MSSIQNYEVIFWYLFNGEKIKYKTTMKFSSDLDPKTLQKRAVNRLYSQGAEFTFTFTGRNLLGETTELQCEMTPLLH